MIPRCVNCLICIPFGFAFFSSYTYMYLAFNGIILQIRLFCPTVCSVYCILEYIMTLKSNFFLLNLLGCSSSWAFSIQIVFTLHVKKNVGKRKTVAPEMLEMVVNGLWPSETKSERTLWTNTQEAYESHWLDYIWFNIVSVVCSHIRAEQFSSERVSSSSKIEFSPRF